MSCLALGGTKITIPCPARKKFATGAAESLSGRVDNRAVQPRVRKRTTPDRDHAQLRFRSEKRGLSRESDAESDAVGSLQEGAVGRTGRWGACRERVAPRRDSLPPFDAEGLETHWHVSGTARASSRRWWAAISAVMLNHRPTSSLTACTSSFGSTAGVCGDARPWLTCGCHLPKGLGGTADDAAQEARPASPTSWSQADSALR